MIEEPSVHAAVLEHVASEYEAGRRESCGLLIDIGGTPTYFPCKNLATNPREQFRMCPRDRYDAESCGRLMAVIHSHPDADNTPSPADVIACARSGVPWVIVSAPDMNHRTIEPRRRAVEYLGRQFQHGVVDCYTLVQDYYLYELGIELPDIKRDDGWWDTGANLYVANLEAAGFVQVETPRKHDGILMAIGSEVPNHSGIYLGDDVMLHHMARRLSGRTVFGGSYWMDHLYGYYRHRSLMDE